MSSITNNYLGTGYLGTGSTLTEYLTPSYTGTGTGDLTTTLSYRTSTNTIEREFSNKIRNSITYNVETSRYDLGTGSMAWMEYEAFSTGTYDKYNYIGTGTDGYGSGYRVYKDNWDSVPVVPIDPSERIRRMIRDRIAPVVHRGRKRKVMPVEIDEREVRARQTLRRVIGERSYRKFMRDGFITIVPKSGLTYRIYPGHGITEVYDRGIMVERLCVVLRGQFPPTDSILMRYLLILNDEGEFSKHAIKHGVYKSQKQLVFPAQEVQPLVDEWAKLKVA